MVDDDGDKQELWWDAVVDFASASVTTVHTTIVQTAHAHLPAAIAGHVERTTTTIVISVATPAEAILRHRALRYIAGVAEALAAAVHLHTDLSRRYMSLGGNVPDLAAPVPGPAVAEAADDDDDGGDSDSDCDLEDHDGHDSDAWPQSPTSPRGGGASSSRTAGPFGSRQRLLAHIPARFRGHLLCRTVAAIPPAFPGAVQPWIDPAAEWALAVIVLCLQLSGLAAWIVLHLVMPVSTSAASIARPFRDRPAKAVKGWN